MNEKMGNGRDGAERSATSWTHCGHNVSNWMNSLPDNETEAIQKDGVPREDSHNPQCASTNTCPGASDTGKVGEAIRLNSEGLDGQMGKSSRAGKVEVTTKKRRAAECGKIGAGGKKRARINIGRTVERSSAMKKHGADMCALTRSSIKKLTHTEGIRALTVYVQFQ